MFLFPFLFHLLQMLLPVCVFSHFPILLFYSTPLGPAMNPVLPTCYALLKTGTFPTDLDHYVVYWAAPAVGAAAAAVGKQ